MSNQPLLAVRDLCKTVGDGEGRLTILQAVNFAIAPGETVAVVGASGSGKSTLLGLLAGLDEPSAGQVCLDGVSLSDLDEDGRARLRGRLLGFVFQSFQLLPALTALENVLLPLELSGVENAAGLARDWLARVGLGGRLDHYPKHLSGGEQQRVALARAFAPAPRLILADEPTGNLDQATGNQIMDLMFRLNREQGTTLVLVTHDPTMAARCGRQLRVVEGRVEALAGVA